MASAARLALVIALALFAAAPRAAHAGGNDCKFQAQDIATGATYNYDLSGLAGKDIQCPSADQKHQYWMSICSDTQLSCQPRSIDDPTRVVSGHSVCQGVVGAPQPSYISCGSAGQYMQWSKVAAGADKGVTLTYSNGDQCSNLTPRTTTITLLCDKTATSPQVNPVAESSCAYRVTISTKEACPGAGGASGGGGGAVFLIILFVGAAVYLAAGVAWQRFRNNAAGVELIPNLVFWTAVPGWIKDGCIWTWAKIRRVEPQYATI